MSTRIKLMAATAVVAVALGVFSWRQRTEPAETRAPSETSGLIADNSAGKPAAVLAATNATVAVDTTLSARGTRTVKVSANRTVTESVRTDLKQMGARVIGPVGARAVLVEATPDVGRRIAADPRFTVETMSASAKVSSELAQLCAEHPGKAVKVSVVGLSVADRKALEAYVTVQGGKIGVGPLGPEVVIAEVDPSLVASLAERGDVRWIESAPCDHVFNDKSVVAAAANIDTLRTKHKLSGAGEKVTVCDTGLDKGKTDDVHLDFYGRVKDIVIVGKEAAAYNHLVATNADFHGHGTHVAGTVLGDGARSDGQYKGMAPAAELYFQCSGDTAGSGYVFIDSYTDILKKCLDNGVYIHSDSWGTDSNTGEYTHGCYQFDNFIWNNPDLLVVVAAGNYGKVGAKSVGSPALSKNVLTVGNSMSTRATSNWLLKADPNNLNPTSSRGPAADGRIKPDITSPGTAIYSTLSSLAEGCEPISGNPYYTEMTGTSMATPLTSGAAALVREWLKDRRGIAKPTAALMKAIITGGGVLMTGVGASAATGSWKKFDLPQYLPNSDIGWGRINLEETLYPTNGYAVALADRIPFSDGSRWITNLTTSADAPLDVQLVWIDYPCEYSGIDTIVNDLDLIVSNRTTGAVWYGNGVEGGDHINTVESVRIPLLPAGEYAVLVVGHAVSYASTEGGAAAVYIRGAIPNETKPDPINIRICKADGTERDRYVSLETALYDVREGETIEILEAPALLSASASVDVNCAIVATNADPLVSMITRTNGAMITISKNCELMLSNAVFAADASSCAVRVAAGGRLALAGKVGIGEVATEDDRGLRIVSAVTLCEGGLTLDASGHSADGDVFGYATCDFDSATNVAAKIANRRDAELSGMGRQETDPVILYWGEVPPDPSSALAYAEGPYDDKPNVRTYYRSLTKLFKEYTNGADVVILKDVEPEMFASNLIVTVDHPMTLRSASGVKTIWPGASSGFRVVGGGSLALTNVTFDGSALYRKTPYNVVKEVGGRTYTYEMTNVVAVGWGATANTPLLLVEGGSLTIGSGATVKGFTTGRYCSAAYGAVAMTDGALTLGNGAKISDCHAKGDGWMRGVFGGGLYAAGGSLNLLGGTISDCSAFKSGGAVYVDNRVGKATVRLEGSLKIFGNKHGAKPDSREVGAIGQDPDNVFLLSTEVLPVFGKLESGSKIGLLYGSAGSAADAVVGNLADCVFASYDCDYPTAEDNCAMLASDYLDGRSVTYHAEASSESGEFKWIESIGKPTGKRDADGPGVKAIVTMADGSGTTYWDTFAHAIKALDGDADIQLKSTQKIDSKYDIEFKHNVRLFATNELGKVELKRMDNFTFAIGSGASLTVSNLVVSSDKITSQRGDDIPYTTPLFNVDGGALTCDCVRITGHLSGSAKEYKVEMSPKRDSDDAPRAAGAVRVWAGGDFTMRNTTISDVLCTYVDKIKGIESAVGGGVLVEGGSTAHLESGMITNCCAKFGGAVFVGNLSKVWLGDVALFGNLEADQETANNLCRHQTGEIVVTQPLVQKVGVTVGRTMRTASRELVEDTNYVTSVSVDWSIEELKQTAGCFRRDLDGTVGKAVTNNAAALIVWRTAVKDDIYVAPDGTEYALVGYGEPKPREVAIPERFTNLIYNGKVQKGIDEDENFDEGLWEYDPEGDNSNKQHGTHYAIIRLTNPGDNVWTDGSSDSKRLLWKMAQKGLYITVKDGIPDWDLAEHAADECPGKGDYLNYFDDYWEVHGVCTPPDDVADVIEMDGLGYYQPSGILSTAITYKVYFDYRLVDGENSNYIVTNHTPGVMHVVSNALSSAIIKQMISNPKLVIRTGGIGGGQYGSATGSESGSATADDAGIVLEIDNAPAGTYNLKGSDTLTSGGFTTEATQTLQETGTLRLQAPASKSTQHFWRIEYLKP